MPTYRTPGGGWDAIWWVYQADDADTAMAILLSDYKDNITAWYYETWLPYRAQAAAPTDEFLTKIPENDYTRSELPCFHDVWYNLKTHLYTNCPKPMWEWQGGPFPRQLERLEYPGAYPSPLCPFQVSWDTSRAPPNQIHAGGCLKCFQIAEYKHTHPLAQSQLPSRIIWTQGHPGGPPHTPRLVFGEIKSTEYTDPTLGTTSTRAMWHPMYDDTPHPPAYWEHSGIAPIVVSEDPKRRRRNRKRKASD